MGSHTGAQAAQTYRRHHPYCQGQGVRWSQQPRTSNRSDAFLAHETLLTIVLLSGIHLGSILLWPLVLTVRDI